MRRAPDAAEVVLKLTAAGYAPLLLRELDLLLSCAAGKVEGVVRPVRSAAVWSSVCGMRAVAMVLPLCDGGDLAGFIARRAATKRLGSKFGLQVGGTLRALLALPRPIVHGDVRPQNV